MATLTIDASNPSATVNYSVLKSAAEKVLTFARRNGLGALNLGQDEYQLLWALVYGNTDGKTATGTTSQVVITYT